MNGGALRRAVHQHNTWGQRVRELADEVGGIAALESLDAKRHPDEPFDYGAVLGDDRAVAAIIVALTDEQCAQRLDIEYRTIARRFLARVLTNDPKTVRRSNRPSRVAAGIMHAILSANGRIGRLPEQFRAAEVGQWFDITSSGSTANSLVVAARFDPVDNDRHWHYRDHAQLPSPLLLHSSTRERLVARRNAAIEGFEEHEARRDGRRPVVHLGDRFGDHRCSLAELAVVNKGTSTDGQTMVLLGFAPLVPVPELDLYALPVSEARRLAAALNRALTRSASAYEFDDDTFADGWVCSPYDFLTDDCVP